MIDSRAELKERLGTVRRRVAEARERSGRASSEVRLVAVTKGVAADRVAWAADAGIGDVGENYVQELAAKAEALAGRGITWHHVGALQSSTAHRVADLADVVHSVVPGHAAIRLSGRAERDGRRLAALIQVDFTGGREGIDPDDVRDAAAELGRLRGIELRGLMTLPPMTDRAEDARPYFRRLRELRDDVAERVEGFRELSMGMSGDFPVAVEEGATMVRIGTALFGERPLTT